MFTTPEKSAVELKAIPVDLARLVRECVDRLETLDLLLLLQSSDRRWTVLQRKTEMRSSETSVELGLGILCARELVVKEGDAHLFRHRSPAFEKMTRDLAAHYPERRAAVIEAILGTLPGACGWPTEGEDALAKGRAAVSEMKAAPVDAGASRLLRAREARHAAYLLAKEGKKNDPRTLELEERLKRGRREANAQAKKRRSSEPKEIARKSKLKAGRRAANRLGQRSPIVLSRLAGYSSR